VVAWTQGQEARLFEGTFRRPALLSLVPAFLAVLALAQLAQEPPRRSRPEGRGPRAALGRRFWVFLGVVAFFELANSADAFLALRARTVGANVVHVLAMLALFNLVYAALSTPAGALSDRLSRKGVVLFGWGIYALAYLGAALAPSAAAMAAVYAVYGVYYGVAYGTTRALVADLVPEAVRGTAYGAYATVVGAMAFPASYVAGLLWEAWGPAAPFFFSAAVAALASLGFFLLIRTD